MNLNNWLLLKKIKGTKNGEIKVRYIIIYTVKLLIIWVNFTSIECEVKFRSKQFNNFQSIIKNPMYIKQYT